MTLTQLRDEVKAILLRISPKNKFFISQSVWESDRFRLSVEINLAIYPEECANQTAAQFVIGFLKKEKPLGDFETPAELLKTLEKAVKAYQKQSCINYKTLELDEDATPKSPKNRYISEQLFDF
ncbi:hypothetical protein [Runella zeae]|uniref:hypothetical protein n=1 Tax=Runella zeae TaxID=94255 RepID=UPI0023520361|nr:hypothetical protein [Runella zeae]